MNEDVKILGIPAESGRWILIAAGMIINLCLGAIYAYSVIRLPLEAHFKKLGLSVTATEMQLPFIVFLVTWAASMPLAGPRIERWGPRPTALLGGILLGSGWFLASLSPNPKMLAAVYGIVGGAGVGLTYGVPLAVSARWFPDKRGLAVGLTILGFGLSAAVIGPLIDVVASSGGGIPAVFRMFGVGFMILIAALSAFMTFPPRGWRPEGWVCPGPPSAESEDCPDTDFSPKEMLRTRAFSGLWVCYALGSTAGLMAVGIAKPVGLEVAANAGRSAASAGVLMTALIAPFAVCNGCGRPLFGALNDRFSPRTTATIAYLLIAAASLLLFLKPDTTFAYIVSLATLWGCLGGWVALAPAATAKFFGTRHYAENYGFVFTAYGAGAVLGNVLAGRIKDIFGTYLRAFPIVAALAVLGIVLAALFLKPPAGSAAVPGMSDRHSQKESR